MLQLKQAPLMVNRGYGRVLAESFGLITNNFKKTFKHLWACSLLLALALALYFLLTIQTVKEVDLMYSAAALPLVLLAEVAFCSRAMMPLNGKGMKWNCVRVAKYGAVCVALAVLILAIMAAGVPWLLKPQQGMSPYIIYICSVATVAGLMLVPMAFVGMKYLMEPQARLFGTMFKGYRIGMRHWGLLFITILLAALAMACVAAVISLPLVIVYVALFFSLQGELNGDEAGMPGYVNAITFIAATITYFMTSFMLLYTLYIYYYLYGSIETREKEKREITKSKAKQ